MAGEVRVLGGQLMFWEHDARFNEMLDEFVAALPSNARHPTTTSSSSFRERAGLVSLGPKGPAGLNDRAPRRSFDDIRPNSRSDLKICPAHRRLLSPDHCTAPRQRACLAVSARAPDRGHGSRAACGSRLRHRGLA